MGCGFWDTLAFMGGVNSMHEWATAQLTHTERPDRAEHPGEHDGELFVAQAEHRVLDRTVGE